MADYQLHCFAQSGNAYKAALMLELCKADWEPVFVDFFKGAVRTDEYRELNVMGEAPVLVHGEKRLSQSGVILDYLSDVLGKFGPRSAPERREILRWTLWDNHKLTSYIATWRFMTNFLPEEKRNADVIAFLEGRARAAIKVLEARLGASPWVAGDAMTTADFSCAGYMFYLDEVGIDIAELPNINRWRDMISAQPGWKHPYNLMPGHPLEL